jgi:hypothetical protein
MAKVFNGGEFLKSKSTKINFSNGIVADVGELSDAGMKALDSLGEAGKGIEDIRQCVGTICGKKPEELKDVGIVELRGVMDFLSESLFG